VPAEQGRICGSAGGGSNIAEESKGREQVTETFTIDDLRQHELVILRRLRTGPLTEFELASEVADNSAFTREVAAERIGGWLEELQGGGFIWAGKLYNSDGQYVYAAALTRRGRELVG